MTGTDEGRFETCPYAMWDTGEGDGRALGEAPML